MRTEDWGLSESFSALLTQSQYSVLAFMTQSSVLYY
jgi:hypothetical protein